MRQAYEILQALDGEGTISQIRAKAIELGYRDEGFHKELRSLKGWQVVEATMPPTGKLCDVVYKIVGKFEFNIVTSEMYNSV